MAENRVLRAGPLEVEFRGGDLWHIRLGDTELVERIYMALRDRNWGTVPGKIEGLSIEDRGQSFTIVFDSVHREGGIDFRWHGTVIGAQDGAISIAMDGRARTSFPRSRIGLCVHHPLKTCAGRPCVVETAGGQKRKALFPEFVAPHQPFTAMRAMSYAAAPGVDLEIRFHGDIFETEDQRNWTDANYKTYGTPLALPFPVQVPAGAQVSQSIELKLRGVVTPVKRAPEGTVRVRETAGPALPLPKLGLGIGGPLSPRQAARLKQLRLSHLRVDLDLDSGFSPLLERAVAEAGLLGVKLEAAITLPGDLSALEKWKPHVERWLVFRDGEMVSSAATVGAARQALGKDAFLVTGTNAYFAELNRDRPSGEDWDAACFTVHPQVHAFDDESVMANTDGQFHAVRSARRFLGGKPVLVSPVTLRPRPDPRQKQPFCAAWTVGSLQSLAAAGAASVTYFDTSGVASYPVFDVLAAVGEFAGGSLLPSEASDPRKVTALLLAAGARRRMLIANRTGVPLGVEFRGAARELAAGAVERVDWMME